MRKCKLILTVVLMLTILGSITVYSTHEAQAATNKAEAVSSSEQKKIEKFLDKYTSEYFDQCRATILFRKGQVFQLNKKRKTDMAIMALNPDSSFIKLEKSYSDQLWKKYNPYRGLWIYSKGMKTKIMKSGKKLFGSSFELEFTHDTPYSELADRYYYFFPLSYDNKYLVNNIVDWGDCDVKHEYMSVKKKNGLYVVKAKYTYVEPVETEKYKESTNITVKLKKNGNSYIISDIKCS
ncbi:MAG: hypothetical protein PUK75_09695 [bacterium]|nr:hypothetical protein [bacterium]MDY4101122.1 hypothetical protein [Lachnospiraceae bacterium]